MNTQDAIKDDIESKVRQSRTFILGAGFSAAAGVPLTSHLLERAMYKFKVECPGVFARVENYAKECFQIESEEQIDYAKVSFSELCTFLEYIELREYGGGERWKDSGSREKLCLRFYLAKTLVEATPNKSNLPELYRNFAAQLGEFDMVLSFNWDPLLEVALESVNKTYTYNFNDINAIKLCKLHGSVNWRLGEPEDLSRPCNTLGWVPMGFTDGMMKTDIFHTPRLLTLNPWHSYTSLREIEPFLVLPGYGKAFDVRSNAMLWYKPEGAFAFTHDVYIIGLSLAPDDFFIRSYFLSNLPFLDSFTGYKDRRVHIINPDPSARTNYDFILSKGIGVLHQEPFSQKHIDLMRSNCTSP